MMKAIFDRFLNHVGWMNTADGMIFDTNVRWIGFIQADYCFSSSASWLGGYMNGTFLDKQGLAVAWLDGAHPSSSSLPLMRPLRPLKPLQPIRPLAPGRPMRPMMPLTPSRGWSSLTWESYINQ